jgi:hypothetical protein
MVIVTKRALRLRAWWVVVAIYLFLLATTGHAAFIYRGNDLLPAQRVELLNSRVSDDRATTMVINALKEEATERELRRGMATNAFNIVLSSILGFLSASAVSRSVNRNEG